MSAHIIGRPNDDLLDILLGHGAEPEQVFIGSAMIERAGGRLENMAEPLGGGVLVRRYWID